MQEFTTSSPEETEAVAAEWAATLSRGSVILVTGNLGAGKTCFSRGFLQGRGGNPDDVSSPSFALVNEYNTPQGSIYHWDLYRLKADIDWSVLDLDDHLADPSVFTLIEWPERYLDLNAGCYIRVRIEAIDEIQRQINISNPKHK